ncbi:glycine--tRNA ligase subunit beta [Alkalicaulis satelles]|uniref:Glycine--tRNA ligase beta subunit n=1 Tax=Alkalicaulis satelles TaxID=2609175 RepID=A0A5M6ZKZ6_9PROT|nr:glycine--tRNA ligase subunit beta [Alkalicaulis satelles]KAA5804635.1 glycine--tRNA ligase subunit beta [Alkalicaulis satelles]
MAELLIEFFCEEIPARMQARAEADLARLMGDALKGAGLGWDSLETFSGPRRLGLVINGLPLKTDAVREERKGPRTDAPEQALQGFLRGAGLASLDACEVREDKKGAFYIAVIETPGRETADVIKAALPDIARNFPWPKSMKFGEGERAQRWVRPLHRLICLLDGQIIPAEVFGLTAANITEGHRIHGNGPFEVSSFADYAAKLKANGVLPTRAERREAILAGARDICANAGLELMEDEGLLEEVTGLVEHPFAVLGDMDPAFLDLPPEVITLTMKTHQKYFAVRDPKSGALAPKFVTLANQTAPDGGAAIAAGNARVLSARLSDARHFWDLDRAKGLDAMAQELSKVTFHDQLGTMADKKERIAALARELAPAVGADPDLAETAARLAKADLVSQMVYEFPELQGVMGRYLALDAGMDPHIADAIRDHYKPQGPSDAVPTAPVSAAVALADKLDTLVGFWAIDEKPTGSKDPFALRRAALGVIRVLLASNITVSLKDILPEHVLWLRRRVELVRFDRISDSISRKYQSGEIDGEEANRQMGAVPRPTLLTEEQKKFYVFEQIDAGILAFFADRLKVHLKDEGIRHDVIDAVFALGDDDLVRVTNKSRALQAFLDTPDGAALLAGYRRTANILSAEEKKGFDLSAAIAEALPPSVPGGARDTSPVNGGGKNAGASDGFPPPPAGEVAGAQRQTEGGDLSESPSAALLIAIAKTAAAPEERALISEIQAAEAVAAKALGDEDFESAMAALARLREPVDAFFEAVVVNDKDPIVRRNRLLLLSRIRAAADAVADFSRLEG